MASIEDKQITKDIVIALIENDAITYEDFPGAKNYAELVGEFYKAILKTVINYG